MEGCGRCAISDMLHGCKSRGKQAMVYQGREVRLAAWAWERRHDRQGAAAELLFRTFGVYAICAHRHDCPKLQSWYAALCLRRQMF
jgi:hypothetical protein